MDIHPIQALKTIVAFFATALSEPDGNGGKASYSRIAGTVVIAFILKQGAAGIAIPPEWMTMFWVLIGYAMVSKVLNSMSPAVLNITQSLLIKAGAKIDTGVVAVEEKKC